MKENAYPVDERGKPDLGYYVDPASYYADMHAQAMKDARNKEVDSRLTFGRRVHACWGLIAKGVEGIPFALDMLRSGNSDAREDAAGILAEAGRDDGLVAQLLEALRAETDIQARDSIILALGALRNRAAVPDLAAIIVDESQDGDTRWTAVEALGKVVRRRFLAQPYPLGAALEWIGKARRSGKLSGR